MKINPFDHNYFLGYVTEVTPQNLKVHFPSSVLLNRFIFSGEEFNGGLVGNFVVIEGENHGFLGKINELILPESERLSLSEKAFQRSEFHPIGKIEILLSFDYFEPLKVSKGLDCFPPIGSKVFVCSSSFIQQYLKRFGVKDKTTKEPPYFDLAVLTSNKKTSVTISQQSLFGRHCAVVGTTGGGKSWTVAKLLEETKQNNGKAVLLDATGEYHTFDDKENTITSILSDKAFFHYKKLTVDDLFFLLKPAGKVQAPKLMEAVRSLKIVRLINESSTNDRDITIENGNLIKANKRKRPLEKFYYLNISKIEDNTLNFDMSKLAPQITNECIWDTDRNDQNIYGGRNDNDVSNCVSLISRINNLTNTAIFNEIFGFNKNESDDSEISKIIDSFLDDKDNNKNLFRIGFEKVAYDFLSRFS